VPRKPDGVRVVRAYAQEDAEIEQFQVLNREYADQNLRLVKYAAAMRPLLFFFIGWFCDHCRGGRANGCSRRDHCRRFHGFYTLPAADDLVPDRSWLCR
jgi:hypothetical protein